MNAPSREPKTTPLPDVATLHDLFLYDGVTGELRWRKSGDIAGAANRHGRRRVYVGGEHLRVHRIIYKMVHNVEPGVIDHINGDPSDNRIENLRSASTQQNNQNRRAVGDLLKGVIRRDIGFGASIKLNGNSIWLGTYNTEGEAHAAYRGAAIALFGEFARFE